jgi:hypothetical protein
MPAGPGNNLSQCSKGTTGTGQAEPSRQLDSDLEATRNPARDECTVTDLRAPGVIHAYIMAKIIDVCTASRCLPASVPMIVLQGAQAGCHGVMGMHLKWPMVC